MRTAQGSLYLFSATSLNRTTHARGCCIQRSGGHLSTSGSKDGGEQPRPEAPVHVQIQQSFLEYPVQHDGVAFAREFGKILSFREDTRELAAKVLLALKKRLRLSIDPSIAVNPGAFYGAHLRLEKDAIAAWEPEEWRFSRKEDQFWEQTRNLERSGLGVVYVASGDLAVVKEFEKYLDTSSGAREATVPVVTKYDLLKGADRRQLDALAFDQQALVDFLVMFKASAFHGGGALEFPVDGGATEA